MKTNRFAKRATPKPNPINALFCEPFEGHPDEVYEEDFCPDCKKGTFWKSRISKLTVCATCHPPASPSLIDSWYETDPNVFSAREVAIGIPEVEDEYPDEF